MPIRPDLRHHYKTPEWKAARLAALERAGDKCEACGAAKDDIVLRFKRWVHIVLTVAHLDHNPANNAPDNLRVLCAGCHLRNDKGHHAVSRATRKDARRPLLCHQP